MREFEGRYPERFFDVAIAEQHALTLAAGLACEGQKPVVAIYSTFLQRAYDQLIHDVALQNLDVTFAIDRAGLVGEDGATHAGSFDISYMRCIPNMILAAPSDENECHQLLSSAYQYAGPAAVRYPRGTGPGEIIQQEWQGFPVGQGRQLMRGRRVAILNFGALLADAKEVAEKNGYSLYDMRWIKPLDTQIVLQAATQCDLIVTLEEGSIAGGAGAAVAEFLATQGIVKPLLLLGIPDHFIEHASRSHQLAEAGLDKAGIDQAIARRLHSLNHPSAACVGAI